MSATARCRSTGIWYRDREEGMSDAEYQLRNWMHFIWLGDQISEQAVHNIDVMNWIFGNPERWPSRPAAGSPAPTTARCGIRCRWTTTTPATSSSLPTCRQVQGAKVDVDNVIHGTEGTCYIKAINGGSRIVDQTARTSGAMRGNIGAAYRQEHKDLVDSIVAGKPIVEVMQTADSSLTAAMGRMSALFRREVDWRYMTEKSELDTFKHDLAMHQSIESPGYAVPGEWKVS